MVHMLQTRIGQNIIHDVYQVFGPPGKNTIVVLEIKYSFSFLYILKECGTVDLIRRAG